MNNMRPGGPNKQRSRGRGRGKHHGGGGGGGGSHQDQVFNIHRTIDSNGPDVKIRGNAHHVYEKYLQLARDSNSAGDRVMAENYLQHAEHYYRLIMAFQAQQQAQQGPQQANNAQPYGGGGGNGNGQQPGAYQNNNNNGQQYRQQNGASPADANGNVADSSNGEANQDEPYREEDSGRYD
jgi:hypothetical protein